MISSSWGTDLNSVYAETLHLIVLVETCFYEMDKDMFV